MKRWSPDKGAFSTFVTANIAPKAQGIYDKYIGQRDVTTLDKPEAREVVAEEIDVDVTPTETARPKVYPATLEVITENITPEVRSEQTVKIKDDINRAVATEGTSPKIVARSIVKQTQTPAYRKLIKDKLGWTYEQPLEVGIRRTYNWIMGEIAKDLYPVDSDKDVTGKPYLAYGNCAK